MDKSEGDVIELPKPRCNGGSSLEEVLNGYLSIPERSDERVTVTEISQILWAAQGITKLREVPRRSVRRRMRQFSWLIRGMTRKTERSIWTVWRGLKRQRDYRTAPSAGAFYPLTIYLVVEKVEGMSVGLYRYLAPEHRVERVDVWADAEIKVVLSELGMSGSANAAILLVADFDPLVFKFGERGRQYVYVEVGAVVRNVSLQSAALGITTVLGKEDQEEQVKSILHLPKYEHLVGIVSLEKK